jgi:hypothetical protein
MKLSGYCAFDDVPGPQYRNGAFKVPLMNDWLVFCSGEEMLEDIRKATDDELSIHQAMSEVTPFASNF